MPNQFSNEYNKLAHYETTANEIWDDTRGQVTHFVSALGTSGTIMGVGMGLKAKTLRFRSLKPIRCWVITSRA